MALRIVLRLGRGGNQPDERRGDRRLPAHGEAKLWWRDESEAVHQAAVHLIDFSSGGLALRASRGLPVGEEILVKDDRKTWRGVVRRCTPDADGFAIGVEEHRSADSPPAYADPSTVSTETAAVVP